MEMCAVDAQDTLVRSTVLVAIRSEIENILDKGFVTDNTQRAEMRAVRYLSTIKVVFDDLLKSYGPNALIASFLSNYIEKDSGCVKKEEDLAGFRGEICMLMPTTSSSDQSYNGNISFRKKKSLRVHRDKKNKQKPCLPSSSDKILRCRASLGYINSLL